MYKRYVNSIIIIIIIIIVIIIRNVPLNYGLRDWTVLEWAV